jgi:hypothetical protein
MSTEIEERFQSFDNAKALDVANYLGAPLGSTQG